MLTRCADGTRKDSFASASFVSGVFQGANQFAFRHSSRKPPFMDSICGFSGNTLLPLIFCSFRAPIQELWRRYVARCGKEGVYRRNGELLAFIEKKDAEAARRLIAQSVNATIRGGTKIYGRPFKACRFI